MRTHSTHGSISKGHKPHATADKGRKSTKCKINPAIKDDAQHTVVTRSRHTENDTSESLSAKRPRRGQARGLGPVIYSER